MGQSMATTHNPGKGERGEKEGRKGEEKRRTGRKKRKTSDPFSHHGPVPG